MPDVSAGARAPAACRNRRRSLATAALVLTASVAAACGKKGPPLPPLLNVPVAPVDVTAKRAGDRVTIRFTIPQSNQSGVHPANLERMEVYAWTPAIEGAGPKAGGVQATTSSGGPATAGPAGGARGAERGGSSGRGGAGRAARPTEVMLTADEIVEHAKLVATVPVRRPPPPPPERKEGEPPPPPPPPPTGPGLDQGAVAEVTDTLSPADREPLFLQKKEPKVPKPPKGTEREVTLTPPDVGPPLPPLPARLYVVVGVNHRGKRGVMSQPIRVALWDPPPPPADLTATVREGAVDLAWTRPDGLRRPLVTNLAPPPAPTTRGRGGSTGTSASPGSAPATQTAPGGAPAPLVPGGTAPVAPPPATSAAPGRPIDEDDEEAAGVAEAAARRDAAMNAAAQARSMATEGGAPLPAPAEPGAPAATSALPSVLDPAIAGTLPSRPLFPWPATGAGFVVYEVQPPDAAVKDVPPPPAVQPFPKPLTPAPQPTSAFTDPRLEYGVTRCYAVRTSEIVGTLSVESVETPPACVSAKDVFAPAAPKSLGAVSSDGAISLIWEGNTETDLGGYIVLRGANGGPLQPLTPSPIRETTFRDTTVRRGTRYTYAVVALDTANPPNRSVESNHVEETAR